MPAEHWCIPKEKIELFSKGLSELNQISIFGKIKYPWEQACDEYKKEYENIAIKVIGIINDKDYTKEI